MQNFSGYLWIHRKAFWLALQGVVDAFISTLQALLGTGYLLHIIDENEVAELDTKIREIKKGAEAKTKREAFERGAPEEPDNQILLKSLNPIFVRHRC